MFGNYGDEAKEREKKEKMMMMIIIIILLSFLCTLSLGCLLRCQMRSAFILWRVFLFWSDTCYGLLYWLEREARSDRRSL